jgi:hypothetical protein
MLDGVVRPVTAFAKVFDSKARELVEAGDVAGGSLLRILSDLCSYVLQPVAPPQPFVPRSRGEDWRSPAPCDLDDATLTLLSEVYQGIGNTELPARVADVRFLRRRHHDFGATAIDAYATAADTSLTADDWVEGSLCLQRALTITRSVEKERARVLSIITTEMNNRRPDPSYFTAWLVKALLGARLGDPSVMEPLAAQAADSAKAAGDWDRAREYLLLLAQWRRKLDKTA